MPLLMIACDIVIAEETMTTCAQGVAHTRFACGVKLPQTSLVRKSNNAGRGTSSDLWRSETWNGSRVLSAKKLCVPLFGDGTLCLYFLVEKKENLDIQLMFLHMSVSSGPGGGNFFSCAKSERPPCASWHQSPQTDELRVVIALPVRHALPRHPLRCCRWCTLAQRIEDMFTGLLASQYWVENNVP